MSKTIESNTPNTIVWYRNEIAKNLTEQKRLKEQYFEAVKAYTAHMAKNCRLAYNLTKRENQSNRVALVKEYKKDYKELQQDYLRACDIYTKLLLAEDYGHALKLDREAYYGKSRE